MRKKICSLLLPALMFVFAVLPAPADDFFEVRDRAIDESSFKLGIFYLLPLLMLENVGYSSNIYNYETRLVPDWTADVGVGARVSAVVAKRFIVQAEELPYYSFYLETKNQRSWNNRFQAAAFSYVGPCNLKIGYSQDNLHQRPNLEFGRPFDYDDREWSGEIDIGRNWSHFFTIYTRLETLEYGNEPYLSGVNLAEKMNRNQRFFGCKLNKKVFTDTIIHVGYEYSDYAFAFREELNANARQFSLGVDFPEIGALQGSFQIGMKSFDPANPFFRRPRRPSGRGDVRVTLANRRLRLNVFYDLQTHFSYSASDLFYDNQSFGGGAEFRVTRFLKTGASFEDGYLRYYSFRDLTRQRSDRLRRQRIFLAFPFIGATAIGVSYNAYRLTSGALAFDQSYNFWGGFITYEF